MPSMFVSRLSFTIGPDVTGESCTPAERLSSFSGSRPHESSSVSHSYLSSVPGIGFLSGPTLAIVTAFMRYFPSISTTV